MCTVMEHTVVHDQKTPRMLAYEYTGKDIILHVPAGAFNSWASI